MKIVRSSALRLIVLAFALVASGLSSNHALAQPTLETVTFAAEPGRVFVPLKAAADELAWHYSHDETSGQVLINDNPVPNEELRFLMDGSKTAMISLDAIENLGANVNRDADGRIVSVGRWWRKFQITEGKPRVEVNLSKQELTAWQGERIVLRTHISSGRDGRTPTGNFRAGPYKSVRHYSSLYNNAPMPWSVQVTGNVFIHGFSSVPDYPASHGCIRMPLTNGNPAKFFYQWVTVGTPIVVKY